MDLLGVLHLDELSHGLANLSMFPYFDMAHYVVSIMALREQPGKKREASGHYVSSGRRHGYGHLVTVTMCDEDKKLLHLCFVFASI